MQKYLNNMNIERMNPLAELATFSKYAAGEGIVLLKNNDVLPLKDKKIAVFGRIQFNYYKSGTGSGGLVNVKHVPSLIESFINDPNVSVNMNVYDVYKKWVEENPFDSGNGQWASEPWNQQEMLLDTSLVLNASKESDIAIVVFGRTAGEDKDNKPTKGSYYLTDEELSLLKDVTSHFKKTIVVLNVGNAMDLTFMDTYQIDGLIFAWHGGQYGALALKDVMVGYKSPSGKLPMTLVNDLSSEPAFHNFGHKSQVIYEEDIYVGYRYFETFNHTAVRYPFGFGLTYSEFKIKPISFDMDDKIITFKIEVKNTGRHRAKEVVQIYLNAPQGLLGKPKMVLAAFAKTRELEPKENQIIEIKIDLYNLASFDDIGYVFKSSFVLEKGLYKFYIGNSSRHHTQYGEIEIIDDIITHLSREISAPVKPFKRIKPDENYQIIYEDVPLRTTNYNETIKDHIPREIPSNTSDITLLDVYEHKHTMDEFIGSLEIDQLIELTRGEGMSSPKVTPGTASAFGGVTDELLDKGIPIACAADGPSGIRMDSGFYASSLPNGIALASSFDLNMVETLYQLLGKEMKAYHIDLILGPGMNILRHPLNGRNFEYYSEDPLLTGLMASSAVIGLQKEGVTGTLKHLFANNQETDRFNVDAVVSERAQREIYLRGFEIAIKVGKARAIMTSYNPVNSLWTASHFEVNSLLLRDEWGFDGILVTDWWAKMNDFNGPGDVKNTKAMIISQNDLYMVISDAKSNSNHDNSKESYLNGELKKSHLQRVAKNILNFLLKTPAFSRMHQLEFKPSKNRRTYWFKYDAKDIKLPLIEELLVNGQKFVINPLIFNHQIDKIDTIKHKKLKVYIHKNKQHAIAVKSNKYDTNIYYFNTENFESSNLNIVDLNLFSKMEYPKCGMKPWEPLNFVFDAALKHIKSVSLDNNVLTILEKDAILSFPVALEMPGKYLVDFTLSSDVQSLAQLPFSLYLNNQYKTTITIHGTEGNKVHARASLLADPGKQVLSIKFNKSNIHIYEIKMMRHG